MDSFPQVVIIHLKNIKTRELHLEEVFKFMFLAIQEMEMFMPKVEPV
jgi:hypothetical protein